MDSTARQIETQTEHLPSKKELEMDALVSQLPVILLSLDQDLRIRKANHAFQVISGYSTDEIDLLSAGLPSIVSRQEREKCSSWLKGVLSGRAPMNATRHFKIINKNGFIVYCLFKPYFFSIQKRRHENRLLHVMILDETDRVLLEQCAVKDERLKNLGVMAAEVAHEIKNTIIAIGGFAKRLKTTMPSNREAEIIEAESSRLERLVKSINAYVKPGSHKENFQPVGKILNQSLQLMAPELKARNIKLVLQIKDLPGRFKMDRDALTEVFINLIRNAVEALDSGGRIIIRSCPSRYDICLEFENRMKTKSVSDPGTMFKSIEKGGKSIGLPLSFRIIRNLGGELKFMKKDNSAIFRIVLPGKSQ